MAAFCLGLFACGVASGQVWYVDVNAAPGGDGASWPAAFNTVQLAIDAAFGAGGGEVWVAEGVYAEDRGADSGALMLKTGVHLYGGFAVGATSLAERDPALHSTILDASTARAGAPGQHVLRIHSNASLHGVTATGAIAAGIDMYRAHDVLIEQCRISDNRGEGGLFASSCDNLVLSRCVFADNVSFGTGGAVLLGCHDAIVQDCIFEGNFGEWTGGCRVDSALLTRCIWKSNHATRSGSTGALVITSETIVEDCIFIDNRATNQGAIYYERMDTLPEPPSYALSPKIRNCLFEGNRSAERSGGAISTMFYNDCLNIELPEGKSFLDEACYWPPIIAGCTFVNNTAAQGGGAIYSGTGSFPINNCIFRNNGDNPIVFDVGHGGLTVDTVTYSNVQGGFEGIGNIDADPLFRDPANGDYRLRQLSPCLDAGRDMRDARYGDTDLDFVGASRGMDGDGQGPGGTGDGSDYDMGAFEWQPGLVQSSDVDEDGVINLPELLRVIQLFNSPGYHCDGSSEDAFAPGPGAQICAPHTSDYNPQDWRISLSELLRLIQLYNFPGYHLCAEGEDGFCPGA